ncbi:MAG: zf-TFIIB domain-containing protein [Jiangellaceae bacterium]
MKCPTDSTTLVMSERAGVEIDYCPECRGVWLDRGELDKILERAEAEISRSAARPPAPTHDEQSRTRPAYDDRDRRSEGSSGYRGKKKEHWLGELFG